MLVTDCWLLLKSFFPLVTGFYAGGVIWKIGKEVIMSRKTASMVFTQCHFLLREEYSMRTWSIVSVLQARKMYQQATEILPFAATLWKDVKSFNIFCLPCVGVFLFEVLVNFYSRHFDNALSISQFLMFELAQKGDGAAVQEIMAKAREMGVDLEDFLKTLLGK